LTGRQENGTVHAEAPDFASYFHQDGGLRSMAERYL
jgi:hypothetical protein